MNFRDLLKFVGIYDEKFPSNFHGLLILESFLMFFVAHFSGVLIFMWPQDPIHIWRHEIRNSLRKLRLTLIISKLYVLEGGEEGENANYTGRTREENLATEKWWTKSLSTRSPALKFFM